MFSVPQFQILDISKIKRNAISMKTVDKNVIVISCRIKGKSSFFYNRRNITVKSGDVLYVPQGSSYRQKTMGEEVIAIHLYSSSKLLGDISVFKYDNPDYICELFNRCYAEFSEKSLNYEYRCMSILYEILSHMELKNNYNETGNPAFERALNYFETHMFETDFSIIELCLNAKISRAYFNQLFKKIYSVTPVAYIRTARIERAKILLRSKDYTNSEIADLCGFNDVKYFYTIFKKISGQTISQYLKNCTP